MKTKRITIPEQIVEITFAEHVGERVRARRTQLGMSQCDVAKACGVSNAFLSTVESGKVGISFANMYELSQVLERPIAWFAKGWD